jgi:F0F1-type ATP synthase membrane subunit a
MLAGHTLLFILGSSVLATKKYGFFGLNILPLLIVCAVLFLELAIAGIQSYVFFILLVIYLADMYSVANH